MVHAAKLPPHLAGNSASGLVLAEPIAQFEIGSMQNFIYLILDWKTKLAAIVDPQQDLSEPLAALKTHGFRLTTIVLTHTHFDHTAGVKPLLRLFPDLEIWVGERDLHRLPREVQSLPGLNILQDGACKTIGNLQLKALLTPGHSAGAVSYFLEKADGVNTPYLFTGDTLFIRDCGRTDLETGSNEAMFQSIQKIKGLPQDTIFLVGHHYAKECATTLGAELQLSPPLRCESVEALANLP